MSKPYDVAGKVLLELDPSGWLALLGAPRPPDRVRVIDADVSAVSLAADTVVRVDDPDPWLLHLEFQAGHDLDILPRMAAYQGVLHDRHRLPVASVLVLLAVAANSPRFTGEYTAAPPLGPASVLRYTVLRVWQVPASTFLTGPDVLLPLAPLADLGPGGLEAVLAPLGDRLAAVANRRLAEQLTASLFNLLGLRSRDMDLQTLVPGMSRIHGYYDNPDVKAYFAALEAEGQAKGLAKGLAEGQAEGRIAGQREVLLAIGRKRFGEPPAAVAEAIRATTDPQRLDALAVRLLDVAGWDELVAEPTAG